MSALGSGPGVRRVLHVGVLLAVLTGTVACGRSTPVTLEPTPTYAPQPTPDRTMEAIILYGSPIAITAPFDVKGSPTPVPAARPNDTQRGAAASRATPSTSTGARPAPTARPSTAENREPAPAPAPKPTAAPARPAPTPTRAPPPQQNPVPAIINPTSILPGGPARQPAIINPSR